MKKAHVPVIDMHNDLLSFLAHQPGRSVDDPLSRSSFSQLSSGNVKLQTLAISTIGGDKSLLDGKSQIEQFLKLTSQHPTRFGRYQAPLNAQSPVVQVVPAFENASAFANETEPLSDALRRLEGYIASIGNPVYISLTWNGENRFGGGNATTVALKSDGKSLLEWMSGKNIAVDFSHTSDWLAHDIIDHIDANGLDIPILASHSNFRPILDRPRNLPDAIASEIIRRKGVIGLNFFAPFIHSSDFSALLRHIEYGLDLGGENTLCFGADFFCDADYPSLIEKYHKKELYFPELNNASVYPALLELLVEKLSMKEEQLLKLASQNAHAFLNRLHKI